MKIINYAHAVIFKLHNQHTFNKYGVNVGKNTFIIGKPIIKGSKGSISLGDNVQINSNTEKNPIGYANPTSFWTIGKGKINIGNNVGMSNCAIVSMKNITIEDNVLLGGGVKIFDTDFHSSNYENRIKTPDPDIKAIPVTIKFGAFIGAGSIILKGVTVGEKSIVGAGSVVTKSIPDGEVWAGNPAHKIK